MPTTSPESDPQEPAAAPDSGHANGIRDHEPDQDAGPGRSEPGDASSHRPSWRFGALAGIGAAVLGLGVAELVAGTTREFRSPIFDVGDRVVDGVPAWLKDLAIELFGTNDKPVLLASIGAVLTVYAAAVGIAALRRGPLLGHVGIALFTLAGATAAVVGRSGTDWPAATPSLVGGLAAAAGLYLLTGPAVWGRSLGGGRSVGSIHPGARRRFIAGLGATVVGGGLVAGAGRGLQRRFDATVARARRLLPTAAAPLDEAPDSIQAPSAATFFTPNDEFYRIDTALTIPQVDVDTWNLTIAGMVGTERTLTYDELVDLPLVEADITMTCVSNTVGGYLIGTARWLGVRLDDLLDSVDVDPAADQIVGRSVDGYTCGFPTAALDGRDALVAIGMNGELLPLKHGYPARLIVPGIYGYASATKWLERIELTTFDDFDHYWVPRGYAAQAPIKLQSRIDTPRGLDRIPPGPFVIGGVAWAQTTGIRAVEVRIDDSMWVEAQLADELNASTWRQWSLPWDAAPGRHSIEVRAIDANGAIQTPDRAEPLPNGATGRHKVVVLVEQA